MRDNLEKLLAFRESGEPGERVAAGNTFLPAKEAFDGPEVRF
jgi:hypothetical protein